MSKYVFKDIELDDDSDDSSFTDNALNPVKPSTSLQGSVEVSASSHERERSVLTNEWKSRYPYPCCAVFASRL